MRGSVVIKKKRGEDLDAEARFHQVRAAYGSRTDHPAPERFPADMDKVLDLEYEREWAEWIGMGDLKRIWYGRGEDAVLLWEEGMEFPPAGEEDEAFYQDREMPSG